jgi:hypothetical protein
LKTREMVWMNSAKACLKLAISQRQLTKRRTNGSVVFRKLENGRYQYDISEVWMYPSFLAPYTAFMFQTVVADTSPTIPDRPILQELVTFDYEQYIGLMIGKFGGIRVGSMDVSFIFAHLNTMLMFCMLGYHRFGFTNSIHVLFTSSCFLYLKIGARVETIFHIGSCALATSTLTSIAVILYVPPKLAWILGTVYTASCILQLILEHKTKTQDVGKLFTFCVVWACVMNSNVLV